jgi:hypothetical protein
MDFTRLDAGAVMIVDVGEAERSPTDRAAGTAPALTLRAGLWGMEQDQHRRTHETIFAALAPDV